MIQKQKTKKINFKIINACFLVVIIVLSLGYITCVNDMTVKGFKIKELKRDISKLNDEIKTNELKIMNFESYENLTKRAEDMNLIVASGINYIDVVNGAVAKK